ncbi:hypothetical protein HCK01_35300, partial [Streptomyces sp. AA8]
MTGADALCVIAGLDPAPIALQAAAWALTVADLQLADPRTGYLWNDGGWIANRRRHAENFIGQPGPCDPPGTTQLLAEHHLDLAQLGRLAYLPIADFDGAHSGLAGELPEEGEQILIRLLDWALAAATHPGTPHAWTETRPSPTGHRTDEDRVWTAAHRLPQTPVPLHLRVATSPHRSGVAYAISPGPEGVPAWVHEALPPLAFGTGPSLPAAMAMAEHAATEAAAGATVLRTADHPLLIPHPAPEEDPQPAALIAQAALHGHILDLYTLVAGLRSPAQAELRGSDCTYTSPSTGHWPDADDGVPATLSADIGADRHVPATRTGEEANTAPVDSPAFRRHLAQHQAAVTPLAARYLTAADSLPGPAPFSARHAAGVAALRAPDAALLCHLEPRPAGQTDDTGRIIRSLPTDISKLDDFVN